MPERFSARDNAKVFSPFIPLSFHRVRRWIFDAVRAGSSERVYYERSLSLVSTAPAVNYSRIR